MKVQAYIYHKRAEKHSDCQDYFGIDSQNNRIAVSDGMSQSIYPQWWAKILVDAYLNTGIIPCQPEELQKYQKTWQDKVQEEIAKREADGKNPWRLRNTFTQRWGAGATLCGFTWDERGWTFDCIGDSSLIVINHDYTIKILSSQEGEFGNQPDYLDSFDKGRGSSKQFQDSFANITAILIVTDPYSELFQKYQNDKEFIKARLNDFLGLTDHQSYCEMVEHMRDEYGMHNDDSTLIVLHELSSPEYEPTHIDNLEELCNNEKNEKNISAIVPEEILPLTTEDNMPSNESTNVDSKFNELSESRLEKERRLSAEENFINAGKDLLDLYNGKKSNNKIFSYFTNLLKPIVKRK